MRDSVESIRKIFWSWFSSQLRSSIRLFLFRYLVNSRCLRFGIKLALSKPWRSKSAIHSASFTSVLRPGNAFMCDALTTMSLMAWTICNSTGGQYQFYACALSGKKCRSRAVRFYSTRIRTTFSSIVVRIPYFAWSFMRIRYFQPFSWIWARLL